MVGRVCHAPGSRSSTRQSSAVGPSWLSACRRERNLRVPLDGWRREQVHGRGQRGECATLGAGFRYVWRMHAYRGVSGVDASVRPTAQGKQSARRFRRIFLVDWRRGFRHRVSIAAPEFFLSCTTRSLTVACWKRVAPPGVMIVVWGRYVCSSEARIKQCPCARCLCYGVLGSKSH